MVVELRRIPLGPSLVLLGLFGGGFLWLVLVGLRFDYLITEVYDGDPGEAIWSLDPLFTIIAAIPGMFLVLVGLIVSVLAKPKYHDEAKDERSYLQLNLFYVGEIGVLAAVVVDFISLLGALTSAIEAVRVFAIVTGAILITGISHILSPFLARPAGKPESLELSKGTAVLLAVEITILVSIVLALRLYVWSFIRSTTLVMSAFVSVGLLLLVPRFLNTQSHHVREDEL